MEKFAIVIAETDKIKENQFYVDKLIKLIASIIYKNNSSRSWEDIFVSDQSRLLDFFSRMEQFAELQKYIAFPIYEKDYIWKIAEEMRKDAIIN